MAEPNHALFVRLFSESRTALRRYVSRLVHSEQVSEDIVQEAFLRTFEQSGQVNVPRAFLFSTARNLAYDALRRNRDQRTDTQGDFDMLGVVSEGDAPEGRVLADEESRLLREAVERLPPQCRAAFALRVFHGRSYKEIARRLGLSPKTVENHIARALRDTHDYLRRRYQLRRPQDHG